MNDYYEVERIITRKNKGKNKKYLIKWEGYSIKDCTWEPLSHLDKINFLVEDFEKNFPFSIDKRLLRKYLHFKKRKNNIHKKRTHKPVEITGNNHIIINLEEFIIMDKEEAVKQASNTFEKIEIEEGKNDDDNGNDEENLSESTEENNECKLIKPIIIW